MATERPMTPRSGRPCFRYGLLLACCAALAFPAPAVAEPSETDNGETDNDNGETDEDLPSFESEIVARRPSGEDVTQATTHIEGRKLRDSARHTTLEAISQESADVYVSGRGAIHGVSNGASGGVHIRGLGGSPNTQILIVEDGVPDYQGIFGHPIPDAYVPFLLDDALVLKGGDSVRYGTNAMGGVIVLRSRWRETAGYELHNDAAYGSYRTLRETAAFLGRFGAWDVAGAVHAMSTDGHRDGAGGSSFITHGAARYRIRPTLSLTVRNKLVHLKGADPGPASHPTPDHWFDVWRDNASLGLDWEHGNAHLAITPSFSIGVHRLYDGFYSVDHATGGNAQLTLTPHRSIELLLGLSAEHTDGEVRDRTAQERTPVRGLTDLSHYNQLTFAPFSALRFALGTRALYNTRYGFELLYKGGASWHLSDRLFLHTRVARNYRQPTIRELYLPFPSANPDLRPEIAVTWDLGAGYTSAHFDASASVYRTRADNLIKYFGFWPSAEVVNIGHIEIWGVEGSVAAKDLGPFSVQLSADWQDVGRYTRQNPRAKINFSVDAGHDFGQHFLGGGISGEWVHGLYMADYAREPIDDAFAMDLSLRYRYTSPVRGVALEPYLFLRNFLNRQYAYVADYPMPGFHALAGLKVEL